MTELNSINNQFEQDMIDAGYKTFTSSFKQYAERGFQKCIRDDKGKRYYITIWHYKDTYTGSEKDSYTADCQFRFDKEGKDSVCDVAFSGDALPNEYRPVTTLQDIEDFFEKFWYLMKPDYYERWD